AFDRESQTVSVAQTPLRADFAGGVQLYGHDLSTTILPADESVDVSLYVSVREHVERRYWPAFTLTDAAGLSWNDLEALPPRWHKEPPHTPYWPPGEYAQWARHLTLLPGTPPGQYRLVGEVFDIDRLQIASLLDEQGNAVSPRFELGALTVTRPRRPFVLQPAHAAPHTFGPVTLLGYNLDRTETSAGDTVLLTLYWRSEAATSNNYTAHVEGSQAPGGKVAFSVDLAPANGYLTSAWQPGDQWRGQHPIQLPAALESGEYQLVLSVPGEAGAQPLGRIKVIAPTRTFTRPTVEVENGSTFEGVGVLEGYTLEREESTLTLNLIWHATASPRVSYAAFVHLSDEAGRAWAQSDAVPAKWTRPTTGWVAGEYVVDPHMLPLPAALPPGQYQLFIGLYDPQTGQRARASGPGAGEDNRVEIGRITLP
ncbi:MAG: hypothetical protein ACRDH2_15565, partial [Anaerolineales bacterium]